MIAMAFYFFAFFLLLSGVGVITFKNPVHSVLSLIFAFFNAAGLFLLLGAEFPAMILIVVYVGAVAVLFLFIVMMVDIEMKTLRKNFAIDWKAILITSTGLSSFFAIVIFFTGIFFILYLNIADGIHLLPPEAQAFKLRILMSVPDTLLHGTPWKSLGLILTQNFFSLKTMILGGGIIVSVGGAILLSEFLFGRPFKVIIKQFGRAFPAAWFFAGVLATEIVVMIFAWQDARVTQDWVRSIVRNAHNANVRMTNTKAIGLILYTEYVYVFQIAGLVLLVAMMAAIILTLRQRTDVRRQNISSQVNRRKEDTLRLKDVPHGKGI